MENKAVTTTVQVLQYTTLLHYTTRHDTALERERERERGRQRERERERARERAREREREGESFRKDPGSIPEATKPKVEPTPSVPTLSPDCLHCPQSAFCVGHGFPEGCFRKVSGRSAGSREFSNTMVTAICYTHKLIGVAVTIMWNQTSQTFPPPVLVQILCVM